MLVRTSHKYCYLRCKRWGSPWTFPCLFDINVIHCHMQFSTEVTIGLHETCHWPVQFQQSMTCSLQEKLWKARFSKSELTRVQSEAEVADMLGKMASVFIHEINIHVRDLNLDLEAPKSCLIHGRGYSKWAVWSTGVRGSGERGRGN